ncbi:hypothetical protein HFN89_06765 [Rhizobium laguerreae]|nr:hypothetical protein [Rhizobium laguerreae]
MEPSHKSAADLAALVVGQRLGRPMLSLTDEGTFRGVWKGDGWQVALHFLGGARVNFVIAHSLGGVPDANYGSSTLDSIKLYLRVLGLSEKMRAAQGEGSI